MMQDNEAFYNNLLQMDHDRLSVIKAREGATYATPNYTSLSILLELVRARVNKAVFIDFGSGTGNVLFLAERILASVCDRFVGVEFNATVNDEAIRRRDLFGSKCVFEQTDITTLSVDWLIRQAGEEGYRQIVLFSFDCRMPHVVVKHTAALFNDYPRGITLLSTFSPHFYEMHGKKFGNNGLVIGNAPYVVDADNAENFSPDELEAFEERTDKQSMQIMRDMKKKGIEFDPSLLSERFTMYVYEKNNVQFCINCTINPSVGWCGNKCRKAAYCSMECATSDYERHVKNECKK